MALCIFPHPTKTSNPKPQTPNPKPKLNPRRIPDKYNKPNTKI